jgi:hypothetical protein
MKLLAKTMPSAKIAVFQGFFAKKAKKMTITR